jgi:HAE1 family hydrophobic/amphiphilic exporter-1
VDVYGYIIAETNLVAEELASRISLVAGARDVQVSRDPSKPELQVVLDQNKMIRHGLNTATVSNAIKNRVAGMTATRLRQFGDEYDVVVRFREESRNSITDVLNISIMNNQGQSVKLGEIAEVKEYLSPPNIEHKRRQRVLTVSATPYQRALGDIASDIEQVIADIETPSGVQVEMSGTIEEQAESFMDLGLLMMVSLILVYLVMASQFESLKMPLIIMFSIPFAFSGVAIALFITGTTLNLIAGIGAVMLIGIVVKNAIVLVDFINLQRDRGLELYEAVKVSGRSRLRPVLMTSFTTILAMLPLALSIGEGSEIWSPMGISVIGGLIFSTMVTLVLVPIVYVIFARRGERDKKRRSQEKYDFLNGA